MDTAMPPGRTNSLDAYWMPFTSNETFKQKPKLFVGASGMYYKTDDGRDILDGTAGLWCCVAGHNRKPIVEAIQRQAAVLDYAPQFNLSHPDAFELSSKVVRLAGADYSQVFYCCSGSEAVDTALKIALAYHRARGQGSRTRLIGRERGYHGVGFGGISVGGIVSNRKVFGPLLAGTDHIRHTLDQDRNRWSKGVPQHGAEFADDLERLCALHDPSTIAAVIVEPVAGSTGVVVPPVGYLQRLRQICDKNGILLIFDEVITGFGRVGTPFAFQHFGVKPDMFTMAKGLTNGCVPMGGVIVREGIYQAMAETTAKGVVEFAHGYTYSAHPLGCAAALATLDLYREEGLFERVGMLAPVFEAAVHSLRGAPYVEDIRNLGLMAGIELSPRDGAPGARGYDVFTHCFENDVLVRATGDTIAIAPPFIVSEDEIARIVAAVREALHAVA